MDTTLIENHLRNVRASAHIEGLDFSEQTRLDCIAVATGEKSADEIIKAVLRPYQFKE